MCSSTAAAIPMYTVVTAGNSCSIFSKTAFSFVLLERVFGKRFVHNIRYNSFFFFLSIHASTSVLQNGLGRRRRAACII